MDRFVAEDWLIESNQGPKLSNSDIEIYDNTFLTLQNHKSGISLEFHTYEALELLKIPLQQQFFYTTGEIQTQHINYINPTSEASCCTSYKGRIKPIHLHGTINIQPSTFSIPFDQLSPSYPIL